MRLGLRNRDATKIHEDISGASISLLVVPRTLVCSLPVSTTLRVHVPIFNVVPIQVPHSIY